MLRRMMYHVVWFAGAILLVYILAQYLDSAQKTATETYQVQSLWLTPLISTAAGLYLGLAKGWPRKFRVKPELLLVAVLSLAVLVFFLLPYFSIGYHGLLLEIYLGLMKHDSIFFFGIIFGYTLLSGSFRPVDAARSVYHW